MDVKKYPALTATLGALGVVALTGVVLAGLEYASYSKSSDKLAATDRKVAALLKEPTAPTKENVEAAKANLDALKSAEEAHVKELIGVKTEEFTSNLVSDPGQFTSNLNASVDGWRKALADAKIPIVGKPGDFAFGFSRYFRTGVNPPQKSTQDVSRQSKIIDFLIRTLIDVKAGDDARFLRLVGVEREPVELNSSNRNFNKDEVSGLVDPTFRREGIVHGEFFRVRFVAKTDVLRLLMNAVSNSGRPIVVRGVDVVPATPEQLAAPQPENVDPNATGPALNAGAAATIFGDTAPAGNGSEPAAAPAGPQPVVNDDPSDITVTFEFVEPAKTEPAKPAEGAEGASGTANNK